MVFFLFKCSGRGIFGSSKKMVTQAAYDSLKLENEQLQSAYKDLQFRLVQLERLIFGSKSERFTPTQPGMEAPTLFDIPPTTEEVVVSTQQVSYERKQKETRVNHPGRNAFPEKLRREEIILNPQGIDLSGAVRVGEDATEVLAYTPAELYVKRTVRPRYHLPSQQRMVQAGAPERTFSRSSVDESLVANVIVEKYTDHLPLYRQAKRYERQGVVLSESTLGDIITACGRMLQPLYEAHRKDILSRGYLHVDETTIKVQDSDKKGATHQGYYWVFYDNLNRSVLFAYDPGRGRAAPQQILEGYQGYLQSDGYAVYEDFGEQEGITLVGCLAHARRKFHEAMQSDKTRAEEALALFQSVYAIERHIREENITGEDKLQYRKAHAIPLLQELKNWMVKTYPEVLPKSVMGKAIEYNLKRWDKLCLYAQTGILEPDNNKVENSIRPVAIGRKNYLFAGSHDAAQRGAMMYSLLGTCKAHGIEPYAWLKDILEKLPTQPINRIKELLPQYYQK
jgi:transposase